MLKLKVAIVDQDSVYLSRLVTRFHEKYGTSIEVAAFGSLDKALEAHAKRAFKVFVVDGALHEERDRLPKNAALAYLVADEYETYYGLPAVRKYKRVDAIYEQLRVLQEENVTQAEVLIDGTTESTIVVFMPVSGGAGASTVAAAASMALAAQGKKVLYLNMEDFGTTTCYFQGQGTSGLDDLILALRMKNANVAAKIKNTVRIDASGVCFVESSKNPNDILALSPDNIETLLQEIAGLKEYDHVIVDVSMTTSERTIAFLKLANRVYLVSNGTDVSNEKCKRLAEGMSLLEERYDFHMPQATYLLYNSFHKATCKTLDGILPVAGGLPHYKVTGARTVAEQLAGHSFFATFLQDGGEE